MLKNGIYIVFFTGHAASGSTVLAMRDGIIAGADTAGAKVTGTYSIADGCISATADYEFLHAAQLATSGQAVPAGFKFQIEFNSTVVDFLSSTIKVVTPQGPANATFQFITDLP